VAWVPRAWWHDRATLKLDEKADFFFLLLPHSNSPLSLSKARPLSLSLTIPTPILLYKSSNSLKFFPISSIPSLPLTLLSKLHTFSSQTHPIPHSFSLSKTLTSIVEVERGRERN